MWLILKKPLPLYEKKVCLRLKKEKLKEKLTRFSLFVSNMHCAFLI